MSRLAIHTLFSLLSAILAAGSAQASSLLILDPTATAIRLSGGPEAPLSGQLETQSRIPSIPIPGLEFFDITHILLHSALEIRGPDDLEF